ncbi:hypothetical protein YC2023_024192 [Brassica napus]
MHIFITYGFNFYEGGIDEAKTEVGFLQYEVTKRKAAGQRCSSRRCGRVRPRRLFADTFSSPATSDGEVPEADNEAILMVPLKQRCSYVLDDGPCSEIQKEDLMAIRMKYAIHSLVQIRCPSAFERGADGGPNEWPSLRTLMSIQVIGELYGLSIGIHEVLYSYCFAPDSIIFNPVMAPLWSRSLREVPGVATLSGITGTADTRLLRFRNPSFLLRSGVPSSGVLPWGSSGETGASDFWAFPISSTSINRLGAALPTARIRPDSVGTPTGGIPLMGIQQRLLAELFLLCNRVRDMAAKRDLLILQVRGLA